MPVIFEELRFFGHPMVSACHPTTLELTKDAHLTPKGDCILGVRADKGLADLEDRTKRALRRNDARVRFVITAPGGMFEVEAAGSDMLSFESESELVIRRSDYVCGRTLAIRSSAAAIQIPREMVQSLRSHDSSGSMTIEVTT